MPNQTHKTIIFEEFNDGQPNLFTIINNESSLDRLPVKLEELTVHSFSEFMSKFSPKVYEVWGKNPDTGDIEFFYTTDPAKFAGYPYSTIEISEHAYYKMLKQLYASKGASGQSNLKFDDSEILEMLTPKKELSAVRNLRESFEYNLKSFEEAKARGDRGEMNAAKTRLTDCRRKISEYATSSVGKLLPILIEDTNKKLEHLGASSSVSGGSPQTKALPKLGQLYLNAAGQLDIDTSAKPETTALTATGSASITNLPAETAQTSSAEIPDAQARSSKIAESIMKDYDKHAKNPSEQVKSLIVSAFAPLASVSNSGAENLDAETLRAKRKSFENAYTNARESFAAEMSRIVESLLGVKTFFDHATADGGENSKVPAGIIIANCKASRLLEIKDKFSAVMTHLGKNQGSERIWFAVMPSVFETAPTNNVSADTGDDWDSDDWDEPEKNSDSGENYVSLSAVKQILEIMERAKITTVFNLRVNNDNTFADLSTDEVAKRISDFKSVSYGHAVYAYPNFTLIRERIFKPFDNEDASAINLPGIFIDAAYPAAGLLVASQQVEVLKSRKLDCDKDFPCVRVDLENAQVKKSLTTKFNRESILRRSEDLTRLINENMFGFAFSGDELRNPDGTDMKNSYVHCARSLAKNEKTGVYKSVYQTLVEDFIARELIVRSKKPDDIQKFIDKTQREWADRNKQTRYQNKVNLLFHENEGVRFEGNRVIVHFESGENYIEVEVESD